MELSLFIRLFFLFLFFSTLKEKLLYKQEHKEIIKNYNIIPIKLVASFYYIDITLQALVVIGMLTGLFLKYTTIICIFLLLTYSIAILVNLIKGNRDMSCGCGGIAGDHIISWKLVVRNLIFLLISSLIFVIDNTLGNFAALNNNLFTEIFSMRYIITLLVFIAVFNSWYLVINIKQLEERINVLTRS